MKNYVFFVPNELLGFHREFVEVERNGEVGDKVIIINDDTGHCGEIGEVVAKSGDRVAVEFSNDDNNCLWVYNDDYRVLEPTNTILVNGKRYKFYMKKPSIGSLLLIDKFNGKKIDATVVRVEDITDDCIYIDKRIDGIDYIEIPEHVDEDPFVLEPVEDYNLTIEDTLVNLSQSFAELNQKVAKLNGELDELRKYVRKINTTLKTDEQQLKLLAEGV